MGLGLQSVLFPEGAVSLFVITLVHQPGLQEEHELREKSKIIHKLSNSTRHSQCP